MGLKIPGGEVIHQIRYFLLMLPLRLFEFIEGTAQQSPAYVYGFCEDPVTVVDRFMAICQHVLWVCPAFVRSSFCLRRLIVNIDRVLLRLILVVVRICCLFLQIRKQVAFALRFVVEKSDLYGSVVGKSHEHLYEEWYLP